MDRLPGCPPPPGVEAWRCWLWPTGKSSSPGSRHTPLPHAICKRVLCACKPSLAPHCLQVMLTQTIQTPIQIPTCFSNFNSDLPTSETTHDSSHTALVLIPDHPSHSTQCLCSLCFPSSSQSKSLFSKAQFQCHLFPKSFWLK